MKSIRKGGHLGEPLSPSAVRDIVKQRCTLAGVMGDFSAHKGPQRWDACR